MKKLISILLLIFTIPCFSSNANETLTQLLIQTHTMQSNFAQTIWNPQGQLIHKSEGTMSLERPGKFRWEITKPTPQLIVANKRKLWIYDKDLEQLTIRPLAAGAGAEPAMLLSDASLSLDKDFYVKQISSSTTKQQFMLTPKDKNTFFAAIKLEFMNGIITEMQFKNHLDQTIIIKFSSIKTNQPLSEAVFEVHVPSNVDVLDETRRRQ